MSRSRRLSEIAKANQPVFGSANGTQWWLADPSSKGDPEPAPPSNDLEPQPAAIGQTAVAMQDSNAEIPVAPPSAPAPILLQQPEPQTPSNGSVAAQPVGAVASEPASPDLPSRLSSLKDRFLSLGRKSRTVEPG